MTSRISFPTTVAPSSNVRKHAPGSERVEHVPAPGAVDVLEVPRSVQTVAPQVSSVPTVEVSANEGLLTLKSQGRAALENLEVRIQTAEGLHSTRVSKPEEVTWGSDAGGKFERLRYPLQSTTKKALPFQATLEVRRYAAPEVIVATLDYDGPPLEGEEGISVTFRPADFAQAQATHRMKLHWTAPSVTSNWLNLAESNQDLLWRRTGDEAFQYLAPLGGDGMVGEVGVKDFKLRVALSSHDASFAPKRVPLFTFSTGKDPYAVAKNAFTSGFATAGFYGKLRWEKEYPEVFRSLGFVSWNAWYQKVSAHKMLRSARSLREKHAPVGFILIDDGWHSLSFKKVPGVDGGTTNTPKGLLKGFDASSRKFPGGLRALVKELKDTYGFEHVGVWHAEQGHWQGVDPSSEVGKKHALFAGEKQLWIPDPREGKGQSFYEDWYRRMHEARVDFLKIDNQANVTQYVKGALPAFDAGSGEQKNIQEAAAHQFGGAPILNSMSLTLENVYNYGRSNVVRTSDDYLPEDPRYSKEHVLANAYNSFWAQNFAFPDYDMLQTHDPHADYHAIARAISGGPIYFSDEVGRENVELLNRLASPNGKAYRLDDIGRLPTAWFLRDPGVELIPLELAGTITRPGVKAAMVAAFNVNKGAVCLRGTLRLEDLPELRNEDGTPVRKFAVYSRQTGSVTLMDSEHSELPFNLSEMGAELFSLVAADDGVAVLGLTDKYLGPAAVKSRKKTAKGWEVDLVQGGDFAAWMASAPGTVRVDGKVLSPSQFTFDQGVLRIPAASLGDVNKAHRVAWEGSPQTRQ
jgi:raffinose synthase